MAIYRTFIFHPILFVTVGFLLVIVWLEGMNGREDLESYLWPSVEGNFTGSEIRNPTEKWYEVWIHYDYRVEGIAYRSSETIGRRRGHGAQSLLRGHWKRLGAEKLASHFSYSKPIRVYYQSDTPSESRIRAGVDLDDPRSLFVFFSGLLLILLGISIWLLWYRMPD